MAQAKTKTGSGVSVAKRATYTQWVWRGRLEEIEEALVRKAKARGVDFRVEALDEIEAGRDEVGFTEVLAGMGYSCTDVGAEINLVRQRLADSLPAWENLASPPRALAA